MKQYQYEEITSVLSSKKVLMKIEELEKEGWELYLLKQNQFLILGSGGTGGLTAIMRKSRHSEPTTE
jgi:hypothetical protein